jgi:hypothetical protein
VATPTRAQARSHYARQSAIVSTAVLAVRRLFAARRPLPEVVNTVSAYQYASAAASVAAIASMADSPTPLVNPRAFMGVSSRGYPISEPLIATIDRFIPAPAEPLPVIWWDEAAAFMASVEQLIASEVADAGRSASQVEFVARPLWTNYVRLLSPPSCGRCAILAGRIYRDIEAFQRHPGCDCVMVPVTDWQDAHDEGLVSAFNIDQVRGLSEADVRSIRDGADPAQVINATRGLSAPGVTAAQTIQTRAGRTLKLTSDGTTKRSAWRKANPTLPVRLRPESIYAFANGDRDEAVRLLRLHGYLTS